MSFSGDKPPHPQFFRRAQLPKINPAYAPDQAGKHELHENAIGRTSQAHQNGTRV